MGGLKMKKKLLKNTALLAAFACIAGGALPTVNAFASAKTTKYGDDFNNMEQVGDYDRSLWSAYSANGGENTSVKVEALKAASTACKMTGIGSANGEEVALTTKDKISDLKQLTFDLKMPASGDWFALGFWGGEKEKYVADWGKGDPQCYNSWMISVGSPFVGSWGDWGIDDATNLWLSVKIVPKSATAADVYIAKRGDAFPAEGKEKTLGNGFSFSDCYVAFANYNSGSGHADYTLDNISITDGENCYTEDFEQFKDYDESAETKPEMKYFEVVLRDPAKKLLLSYPYEAGVNKLAFENAQKGDRLMGKTKIEKEDKYIGNTQEVFSASFELTFSHNVTESETIAYIFGLSAVSGNPFEDCWAYEMGKNGGKIVKYNESGESVSLENNENDFSSLAENGAKITLSLTKKGTFTVAENGENVLTFDGVDKYAGYAGFAAASEISSTVYLDDVFVSNTTYTCYRTKSVQTNFSTTYFGEEGNEDFVSHSEVGSMKYENGEMVWDCLSDGSYFGSAYQYDSFVMDFKLTSVKTSLDGKEERLGTVPNRWIGVDFGRSTKNRTDYGSVATLTMAITPHTKDYSDPSDGEAWDLPESWDTADIGWYKKEGSSASATSYKQEKTVPASYFKDIFYDGVNVLREEIKADDALCVRISYKEGKISLYMKKASEGTYTLYGTVENIDADGYVALVCTGYAFCSIDDFSVTNTSEIYELPDTPVPDGSGQKETEVIYDRGNVDVNWNEELDLNKQSSGCGGVLSASVGLSGIVAAVCAAVVAENKRKGGKK